MNNSSKRVRSAIFSGLGLAGLVAAQVAAADVPPGFSPIPLPPFQADDRVVSDPTVSVADPEFDRINFRVAWQGAEGNLWLANIDPKTGALVLPNGQATVVDIGLPPYGETAQGPEWAFGTDGTYLVYTKGGAGNYALTAARADGNGGWTILSLPNAQGRYQPYGTPEWNSASGPARIVYRGIDPVSGKNYLYWRRIDYAGSERRVRQASANHPQFVEGQDFMVLTSAPSGANRQAALQPLTPSTAAPPTIITTDAGKKAFPQMWTAPEYGELVMAAVIDFNTIGIYRSIAGAWTRVLSINMPSQHLYYPALRTFVYEGKSYLLLTVAENLDRNGTGQLSNAEIWIAGIDPTTPFFRQVSDPSAVRIRKDPEVFFTRSGPVIFYSEKDESTGRWLLRRAATGLHPDYGYDHPAYGGAWSMIHRDNKNCDCTPFRIADHYEEAGRPILPHTQVVRQTIGPEGNTYFPYFEVAPGGQFTGERYFIGFDTYTGAEQCHLTEADTTTNVTANNTLIGADGNFYLAGNEAMNKFTPTGQRLWQTPVRGIPVSSQFAPDGKLVFFSWNGWGYVLEPETGAVLLEKEMDPGRVFPPSPACLVQGVHPGCAYVNTPAVDPFRGIVYNTYTQTNGNGAVDAYQYHSNPHDLTLLWRNPSLVGGSASSVTLSADYSRIYVHDRVGNLLALDATTGAVIWTFPVGYVANASPNVSDNGYIVAGGTQTDPVNNNFIGVIRDFGGGADWVFKDYTYRAASAAAFGRNDRLAVMARDVVTDALALLIIDPNVGIVSTTPWMDGPDPPRVTGVAVREDGWLFVNTWGETAYKAYRPLSAP